MSKFRHEGQLGGCGDCQNRRKVYDNKGVQICLHHDVITPEVLIEQQAQLAHLKDKVGRSYHLSKKPVWENLEGLRQACLDRCVEAVKNKDGRAVYDPRDKSKISTMNIKACEAWLNERIEGTYI